MGARADDVLGGRYELSDLVAAGGMGEVWRARDRVLDRLVAVKVVRPGLSQDAEFLQRFRNEARLAARLSHPHVAHVHDFGEDADGAYLVMELVDGSSVASLLGSGPVPIDVVVEIVRQSAEGLSAAHAVGLVHRDVKPANLLLTRDKEVKVTDFGIARALGEAKVTRTGEVVGTAQYLSPEAALGRQVGPQSDVYALAVLTYELLVGRRPFEGDSGVALALRHINDAPADLPPFVPFAVARVVMRGLAKSPTHRPDGTRAFAGELAHAWRTCGHITPTVDGARWRTGEPAEPMWTSPPSVEPTAAAPRGYSVQENGAVPAKSIAHGSALQGDSQRTHDLRPTAAVPSDALRDPFSPAPGLPSSAAASVQEGRRPQSAAARAWVWMWAIGAGLTALACLLPFISYEGRSWSMFNLAEPSALNGNTDSQAVQGMGWAVFLPMLLVGALALPALLRRPHRVWPALAIPGCLWSALFTIACAGAALAPTGSTSVTSVGVGLWLVPLLGTFSLFAVLGSLIKKY